MKHSLLSSMLGVFLLSAAGCRDHQKPLPTTMMPGASRETIVAQLNSLHATILSETPETIRAEYPSPDRSHPIRVELGFANGTLTRISAPPRAL
jgi:hypothetical protein